MLAFQNSASDLMAKPTLVLTFEGAEIYQGEARLDRQTCRGALQVVRRQSRHPDLLGCRVEHPAPEVVDAQSSGAGGARTRDPGIMRDPGTRMRAYEVVSLG